MTSWLIAVLLVAAFILILRHRRSRVLGGLPSGELIASDHEEQDCPVLVSHRYGLKGKPDALVRCSLCPIWKKVAYLASFPSIFLDWRRPLSKVG